MNIPGLTPASQALLSRYAGLVREWAPRLDLVAPGDLTQFEERHIGNSLRLLPLVRSLGPGVAIDVGSGAGLPGLPLAIAEPDRVWRLLEPRGRRAAFLEEAVRSLGLSCEVVRATAEEAAGDPRLARAHVVATARAVAAPRGALGLLEPLVAEDGVAALFVGEGASIPPEAELWAPGIAIVGGRPA